MWNQVVVIALLVLLSLSVFAIETEDYTERLAQSLTLLFTTVLYDTRTPTKSYRTLMDTYQLYIYGFMLAIMMTNMIEYLCDLDSAAYRRNTAISFSAALFGLHLLFFGLCCFSYFWEHEKVGMTHSQVQAYLQDHCSRPKFKAFPKANGEDDNGLYFADKDYDAHSCCSSRCIKRTMKNSHCTRSCTGMIWLCDRLCSSDCCKATRQCCRDSAKCCGKCCKRNVGKCLNNCCFCCPNCWRELRTRESTDQTDEHKSKANENSGTNDDEKANQNDQPDGSSQTSSVAGQSGTSAPISSTLSRQPGISTQGSDTDEKHPETSLSNSPGETQTTPPHHDAHSENGDDTEQTAATHNLNDEDSHDAADDDDAQSENDEDIVHDIDVMIDGSARTNGNESEVFEHAADETEMPLGDTAEDEEQGNDTQSEQDEEMAEVSGTGGDPVYDESESQMTPSHIEREDSIRSSDAETGDNEDDKEVDEPEDDMDVDYANSTQTTPPVSDDESENASRTATTNDQDDDDSDQVLLDVVGDDADEEQKYHPQQDDDAQNEAEEKPTVPIDVVVHTEAEVEAKDDDDAHNELECDLVGDDQSAHLALLAKILHSKDDKEIESVLLDEVLLDEVLKQQMNASQDSECDHAD